MVVYFFSLLVYKEGKASQSICGTFEASRRIASNVEYTETTNGLFAKYDLDADSVVFTAFNPL